MNFTANWMLLDDVDMRNPQIIETVWGVGYRFNRL